MKFSDIVKVFQVRDGTFEKSFWVYKGSGVFGEMMKVCLESVVLLSCSYLCI